MPVNNKGTLLVMFLLSGACATTHGYTLEKVEVLAGEKGEEAVVAKVKDAKGSPNTLIRYRGGPENIEDLVLPYQRIDEKPGQYYYSTTFNGRSKSYLYFEGVYKYFNGYKPVELSPDEQKIKDFSFADFINQYHEQKISGKLDAFAKFNRERTIADLTVDSDANQKRLSAACPGIELDVDWASFDTEALQLGRPLYCSNPSEILKDFCHDALVKDLLVSKIKKLSCRLDKTEKISFQGDTLTWQFKMDTVTKEQLKTWLQKEWSHGAELSSRYASDHSTLCQNDAGIVIGFEGMPDKPDRVFFGNAEQLQWRTTKPALFAGQFFDPREFSPKSNPNLRGVDWRYISSIKADEKGCRLQCGERKFQLKVLPKDKTFALLNTATMKEFAPTHKPFALARNRKGDYFYVENGAEVNSKRFRVFVGPKGRMKEMKMINIIHDSEGVVFKTKKGTLKLVIEKEKSLWIKGKKEELLVNVPLYKNFPIIYNELGIYIGKPYGTPCDLF